mmetsp:Transcript_49300/g.82005  ORF Transcript_49300/g.82005 Transcript_49300/m.82005 type:complete len:320 (-) Transcript_49300:232-1191(-)
MHHDTLREFINARKSRIIACSHNELGNKLFTMTCAQLKHLRQRRNRNRVIHTTISIQIATQTLPLQCTVHLLFHQLGVFNFMPNLQLVHHGFGRHPFTIMRMNTNTQDVILGVLRRHPQVTSQVLMPNLTKVLITNPTLVIRVANHVWNLNKQRTQQMRRFQRIHLNMKMVRQHARILFLLLLDHFRGRIVQARFNISLSKQDFQSIRGKHFLQDDHGRVPMSTAERTNRKLGQRTIIQHLQVNVSATDPRGTAQMRHEQQIATQLETMMQRHTINQVDHGTSLITRRAMLKHINCFTRNLTLRQVDNLMTAEPHILHL